MTALAMILAGGQGPGLSVLTALRSEAAVPFGGKYRIADFALSNCVNSGIYDVAVLTQYQPRSLNEHIGLGRPWDLDRSTGGVRLLQPYQSTAGDRGAWQEGTADAIRFNRDLLRKRFDQVLVLAGDHVYSMDYRPLLEHHQQTGAELTLAVRNVPGHDAHRYGMVAADNDGRIVEYAEKPRRTRNSQASMGIYVFEREVLVDWLQRASEAGRSNLGRDVIPAMVKEARTFAWTYHGYWADVGTIPAYFEANMALLNDVPALNLNDPNWVIHTRSEERPAAFLGPEANVEGSLLCDGCRVWGTVVRSIISPGVQVEAGAVVRDAILMTDTHVKPGAVVDRSILDKRVLVEERARVATGDDFTPNRRTPVGLASGICVVGKGAHVPAGVEIGRNVVVQPHATVADYPDGPVASGHTVG